jgi:hypothetical protein
MEIIFSDKLSSKIVQRLSGKILYLHKPDTYYICRLYMQIPQLFKYQSFNALQMALPQTLISLLATQLLLKSYTKEQI